MSMWTAVSDYDYAWECGNCTPDNEPIDEIDPDFSPEFLEGYYTRRAGDPLSSVPYAQTFGGEWRKHRDWIAGWEMADQELAQDPGDTPDMESSPDLVAA